MPARQSAIAALLAWDAGQAATVVEALDAQPAGDPRERGLAQELALGAVTWQRLYDHLADRFLRAGRQPVELRAALRVLAHQLFALDRIPPHAAVGETVQALRALDQTHLVPVANAIGRKLAALRQEQRLGDGPCGRLAEIDVPAASGLRHSLPDLLVDDLLPVLPDGPRADAFAALNHLPPLCTRSHPGQAPLIGHGIVRREEAPGGDWTWWEDPTDALALVADGRCVVQDRAQGEVAEMARVRPGERVLDLCAAPGGKSSALLDRQGAVYAADSARGRMTELRGIAGLAGRLVVQDGGRPALAEGAFDVVVVDAPCSNTGVLARRPEARWRYDRKHLGSLEPLQRRLLRAGADLVAPGGRLVYSTCSLSPRENQGIAHFLDGWRILAERLTWPDGWQLGGYACLLVRSR